MDTVNNPNGGNLGFSTNEGKVALRIWDMSPETSIVRALIRSKIVQHLSKQAAFLERDHDQREKIVRRMDDILFERAPSQVHYMNLETLESRLNYVLNCHKNVDAMKTLDRDVFFLSNGTTAASCKRSHQMNLCSPDTSYHNTSISSGDSIPFEQCDSHFMPDYSFDSAAKLINPASSFDSTGNFNNVHPSVSQSYLRTMSVGVASICWEKEQHLQYSHSDHLQRHQKELCSQQLRLWPRNRNIVNRCSQAKGYVVRDQSCDQFDRLQLQQGEQYLQQQHLSTRNDKSRGTLLERKSNGYHRVPKRSQSVCSVATRNLSFVSKGGAAGGQFGMSKGESQFAKKCTFHLQYYHALSCTNRERKCDYPYCMRMKLLLKHVSNCNGSCSQKACSKYKKILTYYQECRESDCRNCGPDDMKIRNSSLAMSGADTPESMVSSLTADRSKYEQPPAKRTKIEESLVFHKSQNETSEISSPVKHLVHSSPEINALGCQELSTSLNTKPESMELDTGPSSSSAEESHPECDVGKIMNPVLDMKLKLHLKSSTTSEVIDAHTEKENKQPLGEKDVVKLEGNCTNIVTSDTQAIWTNPRKQKESVSLINAFSPKKIKEHMNSLHQLVATSKGEESQEMQHEIDESTCSLCGMKDLPLEPPARHCVQCYKKINHKATCYSINTVADESDLQILFCCQCFREPDENVSFGDKSYLKTSLVRTKNYLKDDDQEEGWVQCDKCKAWQHQICALFNPIKNEAVNADHTCPNCILKEIDSGENRSLSSTVLGAKGLPTTILSDHIEKWLYRRLEAERQERAKLLGKTFSEVPAAEGLIVRVVSSVSKKLQVKQVFQDIFQEDTYPSEFPYKSKAILLFQNIDGADVCLFGMYVQEYGARCADPNRRRVSISYIDSVKYFRPEVIAVTGEALRTFVYHEILIGYLDYCKKRGFASIHIWACPPLKQDDDYILYCHPKIQKVPKPVKLREWYQTIIQKAVKEKIVAEHTNLYDHFFVKANYCKAKITASRLPYFDGDYWPGQAEILLQSENCSKPRKKGRNEENDRVLRPSRCEASIDNRKEILLMYELGNNIFAAKEDFIIAHLSYVCKHCCHPILSEKQWVCSVRKNFHICEKCFLLEQNLEKKHRHPYGKSEIHSFHEVQVDNIPAGTIDDDDETIQCKIFDTRSMFLSHCQSNHYQFDTLRRAKHSTMMILYNLHNQFFPSISAGIGCRRDIETALATVTDNTAQQTNQSKQVQSFQELSGAALLHASKCVVPRCTSPHCRKLKDLFHHGTKCETRASGGCKFCRIIWYILPIHAQSCAASKCHVPQCKNLKEHLKKKQLAEDSQQKLEDCRPRAGGKQRMRERIMRQKNSYALQANA